MKIYSVALNLHDHNTYNGIFHNQRERYTRFKHNVPLHMDAYAHHSDEQKMNIDDYKLSLKFYSEYFKKNKDYTLAFSFTQGGLRLSLIHI